MKKRPKNPIIRTMDRLTDLAPKTPSERYGTIVTLRDACQVGLDELAELNALPQQHNYSLYDIAERLNALRDIREMGEGLLGSGLWVQDDVDAIMEDAAAETNITKLRRMLD